MTAENNNIIAEFMGYIDNGCSEEGFLINPITNFDEEIQNLKYHSDWNWLMEVVEKIESLQNIHGYMAILTINKQYCEILLKNSVIESAANSKIEAVYNACLTFIEWYNENAVKELKTERK